MLLSCRENHTASKKPSSWLCTKFKTSKQPTGRPSAEGIRYGNLEPKNTLAKERGGGGKVVRLKIFYKNEVDREGDERELSVKIMT